MPNLQIIKSRRMRENTFGFFIVGYKTQELTGGKGAGVDDVGSVLFDLLAGLEERRAGKGHETGTGGLQDTEGADELHEGVDTGGLGGAV